MTTYDSRPFIMPAQRPPKGKVPLPPAEVLDAAIEHCIRTRGDFNVLRMKLVTEGLPENHRQLLWTSILGRHKEVYGITLLERAALVKERMSASPAAEAISPGL